MGLDCLLGKWHVALYYIRVALTWIWLIGMIYAMPVLLYWFELSAFTLLIPYWLAIGSLILTNMIIFVEMTKSIYVRFHPPNSEYMDSVKEDDYPKHVALIVAAYLPNEIDTIKESLQAMLAMYLPKGVQLRILVAHNGGKEDHIARLDLLIEELKENIKDSQSLEHLYVRESTSKAANVNAAIDHLCKEKHGSRPDVAAMFDADHKPVPENLHMALHRLVLTNADLVQGRCCVAEGYQMIAIEFDIIYCIYHLGGRWVRGFGIFGGSNGYWRFAALKRIKMRTDRLTEDVDSGMRAMEDDFEIVYDRYVVSLEEAPPSVMDLIKQRLRWAQGWAEVSFWHSIPLVFGPTFGCSIRKRVGIFFLLIWREIYYYLGAQALPAGIIGLIKCVQAGDADCVQEVLIALSVVFFVFPIVNTIVAYLVRGRHHHPGLRWHHYVLYTVFSIGYEMLKYHLSIIGHARNVLQLRKWRVTKRRVRSKV